MIDESQEKTQLTSNTKLQAHFYLHQNQEPPLLTLASLISHYLILDPMQNLQEKCKIEFDFDTVFSVIRDNQTEEEIKTNSGRALGLKFEKYEQSVEMFCNSPDTIQIWSQELAKMLNQRNFHQTFKPIKKVGKGNFATVYLVMKNSNKKEYAVKAFSKETQYAEERGKEALKNQINIMRALESPNLMKLQGVYETENSLYICLEYLPGGNLYEKIKQRYKFTPEEVRTVMKSLCQGLAVMHDRNIMHRDLKPENIMLRSQFDLNCVIGDFGLATFADAKDYIYKRCGTPGYVAPQISNLKDNDVRYDTVCDMFSLGVIFHILALNKPPFPGKEVDEVLRQNRECDIDFTGPQYKKLLPQWLDLLTRMLEKQPQNRITAREALIHKFFEDEEENPCIPEELSVKSYEECESPLMMSKNPKRRKNMKLRDDSCLKFKMKENMIDDGSENSENVDRINSPVPLSKKIYRQRNERKCKTFQPSNFRQQ